MRKINVAEFMSLDGVLQDPNASEDDASGKHGPPWWISMFDDPVGSAHAEKAMNKPFDLLLGRKTFDIWAGFWPQHNDIWPAVNSATKYVASNTLTSSAWQPTVILNGDIAAKVADLKQTEGPDLHVAGSANLVQTLMKHDLVDTFNLMIFPVTLGGDIRLFGNGTIPALFKVTDSTVTPTGVIIVTYERAGAVPTGSL